MPTYHRFEDLPVWQAAATLYDQIDRFLQGDLPHLRFSFRDQLERAALSVSNNIAEGFERGTNRELLAFIYIARGSAGEVRSMLLLLSRRSWIQPFHTQIRDLISHAESCSRQLRAWAESLQNSPITGHRNLNEKTRHEYRQQQNFKHAEFEHPERPNQDLPPNHP